MMVQKPRDTAKAAVRGKYSHTGLPQEKKSQMNNLNLHLDEVEKEKQQLKISRRQEIVKIREKIKQRQKKNRKDK